MIQVPKRLLSIGGRLLISDSITSTSGNNIVPGVVIATGFEIYDCKDIIIKANNVTTILVIITIMWVAIPRIQYNTLYQ